VGITPLLVAWRYNQPELVSVDVSGKGKYSQPLTDRKAGYFLLQKLSASLSFGGRVGFARQIG
jgi:hypothetical protein